MGIRAKPIDPYVARLIEVSKAYYLEDQTQAEIARSLGVSRSQVSRYLTAARDLGIVDIRVVAPEESLDPLCEAMRRRFPHLKDVVVAPTFSEDPGSIRKMIGRAAASYVAGVIEPGQRIALGCGRTIWEMVRVLGKQQQADLSVVQAMGNIGHEVHKIDYNEIVQQAASALGAEVFYMSAPAILGRGSGDAAGLIEANPMLGASLALAKAADIYIVAVGSLESDQIYTRSGLIQPEELEALKGCVVGDVCARFFDEDGEAAPSPFEERVVGIQLDDLRASRYSIALAGGPDKVAPLLGALRGKLINLLVSDERTIEMILEAEAAS